MTLSMYEATVPAFVQTLGALSKVLTKGQAHAAAKKFDPSILVNARLAPDMHPLSRQVQIASDFAKGSCARLAGAAVPSWADEEKTIEELQARIRRTLDFVQGFTPAQLNGSETRDIELKVGGKPLTFKGSPYLFHFVLPNFYFHAAVTYAILRHNGVELGKLDFLGPVPGMGG